MTEISPAREGKYRIVELTDRAHRPDWPWRFQVEECWPARRARFLWWSWTVPETWVAATDLMKFDQCRMWVSAAERGELTKVVYHSPPTPAKQEGPDNGKE